MNAYLVWKITITSCLLSLLVRAVPVTERLVEQQDADSLSADYKDTPWQLYLFTTTDAAAVGACGAALISPHWAITTATCMNGSSTATVMTGSSSWVNMLLGYEGVSVPVLWYYVHPLYRPALNTVRHNLALLRLAPSQHTEYLKPISLPFPRQLDVLLPGKVVTVAGWGATQGNSELLSPSLRSARLRVMLHDECAALYGRSVDSSAIWCARGEDNGGNGICMGDSGVGVSYRDEEDHLFLVGIAEFRDESCKAGAPTGFVRVDAYLPWITLITGITP